MIVALIPAAGGGSRLGAATPKQYVNLAGRPLVCHAIETFAAVAQIDRTCVVVAPDDVTFRTLPLSDAARAKTEFHAVGGASRQASVASGLDVLATRLDASDWVLVHDAARPGLTSAKVEELIDALRDDPLGGLLAVPVADTLKEGVVAAHGVKSRATVPRQQLWQAQTPQMFRLGRLRQALREAALAGADMTDEAGAMERLGDQPRLILGSYRNFKVTYPEDLEHARTLLDNEEPTMGFRIGQGFDVHRLVAGRPLIIGGVTIAHPSGLLGHSDADVLYHAITDALFGAAALGDIGRHFPDTDAAWKGADSGLLLAAAAQQVRAHGYRLANVDATVIAEAPRLAPHIAAMVENIARHLGIATAQVNVKAKTAEGLGALGRLEGIAAQASVLVQSAS